MNGLFAGIMPVGFEGGHGTAGGMGPVNWAVRKGYVEKRSSAFVEATPSSLLR